MLVKQRLSLSQRCARWAILLTIGERFELADDAQGSGNRYEGTDGGCAKPGRVE